jgi:hypothetical protein
MWKIFSLNSNAAHLDAIVAREIVLDQLHVVPVRQNRIKKHNSFISNNSNTKPNPVTAT